MAHMATIVVKHNKVTSWIEKLNKCCEDSVGNAMEGNAIEGW